MRLTTGKDIFEVLEFIPQPFMGLKNLPNDRFFNCSVKQNLLYDHTVLLLLDWNKLALEAHAGIKFIKKRLMSFSLEKSPCIR